MKPLVSVLMLVYNHERYLREALDSILMQHVDFNYEIVAGNDASQDNSAKILDEYQRLYPGILRVIHHPVNIGAMNNHKQTMQACKGTYVAICEGDDYWTDRNKLKKQVQLLESVPELSFVCHRVDYFFQNENRMESWGAEHFLPGQQYRKITLETLFEPYLVRTVSVMYRASNLHMERALQQDFFKDLFLYAMLLAEGEAWFVNESMAVYRIHENGIWSGQGNIRNLYSNAMTGVQMDSFFNGDNAVVNQYTFHQLKNLFDALRNDPVKNHRMISEIGKPFIEKFSHHLSFGKQLKYRMNWYRSKMMMMIR